jgi:hypothetical protein
LINRIGVCIHVPRRGQYEPDLDWTNYRECFAIYSIYVFGGCSFSPIRNFERLWMASNDPLEFLVFQVTDKIVNHETHDRGLLRFLSLGMTVRTLVPLLAVQVSEPRGALPDLKRVWHPC